MAISAKIVDATTGDKPSSTIYEPELPWIYPSDYPIWAWNIFGVAWDSVNRVGADKLANTVVICKKDRKNT